MARRSFTLAAATYREIAKAVKPHVDRSKGRPVLGHVHVEFDGERVRFEATDAYSFIRSVAEVQHDLGEQGDPFRALLDHEWLLGLKPKPTDLVTVRLVDDHHAEVACPPLTVTLDVYDELEGFPEFGSLAGDFAGYADSGVGSGIGFNPVLLARLTALPTLARLRFLSPLRPMFAVSEGNARHEVLLMPVRLMDGQKVEHRPWVAAKPARKRRAA